MSHPDPLYDNDYDDDDFEEDDDEDFDYDDHDDFHQQIVEYYLRFVMATMVTTTDS